MRQINVGSLCSGYGGLDMAVEALIPGAVPVWFAETAPGPSRILAHHYPDVPNIGDLTVMDWYAAEPIDILTAGWPCQPWSAAGKRKGAHDERAIWPEVHRAIRELRPRLVLLENVARIASVGELARAVGSLSEIGYDTRWRCLRASDVGAPHRRDRCFIVAADTTHLGYEWGGRTWGWWAGPADRRNETAADADDGTRYRERARPQPRQGSATAADTGHHGRGRDTELDGRAHESELETPLGDDLDRRRDTAPDPERARLEGPEEQGGASEPAVGTAQAAGGRRTAGRGGQTADRADGAVRVDWGPYADAVQRWEHTLGREAPEPTEPATRGGRRLSPRFVEWMMGLPDGWVTGVPDLSRTEQLKALGNGVVPQQALAAYAELLGLDMASVFIVDAPVEGRLLPTPETGVSPNGHGRRGGRANNGHQSGASLDVVARLLPTPSVALGTGGQRSRSGARKGELLLGGIAAAVSAGNIENEVSA